MKRQPMACKKIFVNYLSDEWHESRRYEEFLKLIIKRQIIIKWAWNLNRHFYKEEIQKASNLMKRLKVKRQEIVKKANTNHTYQRNLVEILTSNKTDF